MQAALDRIWIIAGINLCKAILKCDDSLYIFNIFPYLKKKLATEKLSVILKYVNHTSFKLKSYFHLQVIKLSAWPRIHLKYGGGDSSVRFWGSVLGQKLSSTSFMQSIIHQATINKKWPFKPDYFWIF